MSGSLWGAVVVSVTGDKTFEETAEDRLSEFANLVAVALANAEAREQLAASRRGTCGAQPRRGRGRDRDATRVDVFDVVTEEVGQTASVPTPRTSCASTG